MLILLWRVVDHLMGYVSRSFSVAHTHRSRSFIYSELDSPVSMIRLVYKILNGKESVWFCTLVQSCFLN